MLFHQYNVLYWWPKISNNRRSEPFSQTFCYVFGIKSIEGTWPFLLQEPWRKFSPQQVAYHGCLWRNEGNDDNTLVVIISNILRRLMCGATERGQRGHVDDIAPHKDRRKMQQHGRGTRPSHSCKHTHQACHVPCMSMFHGMVIHVFCGVWN